jgi:glyoxylase-like metal-dependent hydrolase (beta-lactamase superfamily II)
MTAESLLIDCLITEQEGRDLAAWVASHGIEPDHVHITHPHGDHLLGLPEILATFPKAKPVALADSISAMEEQISPGYMQIWSGFFPGQLTSHPWRRVRWRAQRFRSGARRRR